MPVPSRIGRYDIVECLGEGGMGVVYLATDPELRRLVAVKVLAGFNDNSERGHDLRERFAREARAVAALNHNHIVGIHDVGDDDGRPFIVMQFLDGETMAEFIRRKPIVPAARKLKMLSELCNGLGYAHRSEIIHRDIKPANIMLTTEGGLKIMDFGLARLSADASTGLTRTGSLMGTQYYMSPEQWKSEPVDSRADIFAVGVVMYELLTYDKPFTGEAAHVVMLNILQMVPPPMRDIVPSLDPDLDRIVSKALEKDRERRYQSLQVMEADLQRVLDQTSGGDTDATAVMKRSEDPERPSRSGSRKPRPPSSRIPNFEAISERRKAQIDAHLTAASDHLAGGRYAEAVEECEHAVILDVGEPRALEMLELAHQRIEDDRVRGWLEEIRADISRGALSQAEALIGETLRLRPESADALGLQMQIRDRRREEERAAERARGFGLALARARGQLADEAFDAAGRSISEVLAFDPTHPEALALRAQLRAALEERQRLQAIEQQVERAATAAKEAAARRAAEEAEARRLAEAVEARRLADERRQAAEVERRRAEDERRQQAERLAKERRLKRDRADDSADDTVVVTPPRPEPAADVPADQGTAVWDGPAPEAPPRSSAMIPLAALLLVGAMVGGWWLYAHRASPPPPPKADFAITLADAEAEFQKKNLPAAIALVGSIPAEARERAEGIALLRRMKAESSDAASAARRKAEAADAQADSSFRDGEAEQREADNLQRPEDTERAVDLYQKAARAFDLANSTASTPAQFVTEANRLKGTGDVTGAIGYALQALERSPRFQPAMQFLNEQRQEALQRARDARERARNAGAADTSAPFLEGRRQEQTANASTAPADTLAAVSAYGHAAAEYGKAHDAAVAMKAANEAGKSRLAVEAQGHVTRAKQLLDAGDLLGARAAIAAARTADPTNRDLDGLEKRVTEIADAEAKARAARDKAASDARDKAASDAREKAASDAREKAASDERRITQVLAQSRTQSDADAVATLQSLQRDFPNNTRISQALSARTRIAPPPPSDERPAIVKVLNDFAAAYSARNTAGIQAVWPGVGNAFQDTFRSFDELTWRYDSQDVNWAPSRPDVGAGRGGAPGTDALATATCQVSISQRDNRGRRTEQVRTKRFMLEKSAGVWRIVSYTDVTK